MHFTVNFKKARILVPLSAIFEGILATFCCFHLLLSIFCEFICDMCSFYWQLHLINYLPIWQKFSLVNSSPFVFCTTLFLYFIIPLIVSSNFTFFLYSCQYYLIQYYISFSPVQEVQLTSQSWCIEIGFVWYMWFI